MLNIAMAAAGSPDFARAAADYARHRAGFPGELLDRLAARGIARAGARVVDLGTGTGSFARLFAQHGCAVTGVDVAGALLAQARLLDGKRRHAADPAASSVAATRSLSSRVGRWAGRQASCSTCSHR